MKVDDELIEAFDEYFTKARLEKGYLSLIQKVFSGTGAPQVLAPLQEVLDKKTKNKGDLLLLVSLVFSDKTLFDRFFSLLQPEVRQLFEFLVWEDGFFQAELLEKRFGLQIVKEKGIGYGKSKEITANFLIFGISEKYEWREGTVYFLGLPSGIKKTVSHYFDKPEGYYYHALAEVPENLKQFNAEEIIFQELPRIMAYENQGNIKVTNSGIPAVSTFNKMRKTLSLKEFHEGASKPYDTLRTSLIATLLAESEVQPDTSDPLEILYKLFEYFRYQFYPLHLLNYLKGLAYIEDYYKVRMGEELMGLLAAFPEEEGWISMENVRRYSAYRSLWLDPADARALRNYAYLPVKEQGYTDKIPVSANNYLELIKNPLLKASFFLFAAFGLVEAAYAPPPEENEDSWTPYDELQYVRLTALGAYLTGKRKNYEAPKGARASIQMLEDSLNILSERPDETVDLLLDNYTVKVGPSRYRTDFGIFMKGVRTGDDLEAKISLFRQTVADAVPPNWEAFFETLRMKCDPLKSIGEHMAYQLSQNDKEMIHLVAKDPVLKQLTIKAEGLIIIVMKKDQAKFKNRLKEFGYLLE